MPFAGTQAITELWANAKAAFGRKVAITKDTTSVTVKLQNNAGTDLDTVTIPVAGTDNQAGVMSNAQATKLAGIASGATAVTDSTVSGWGYKKTDNNTTYTLTQDATDGHKLTFTPSSGNATTIIIPDNDTTYESKAAASGGTAVSLVTTGEKHTWNSKGTYSKPSGGIPKTDLASAVQTSLGLAETALQSHQSLSNYYTKTQVDSAISTAIAGQGEYIGAFTDCFTVTASTASAKAGKLTAKKAGIGIGDYMVVTAAATVYFSDGTLYLEPGDMVFMKAAVANAANITTLATWRTDANEVQSSYTEMTAAEVDAICV